jgi:hypothetical protein
LLLVLVFTLTASNSTPRVSTLRPITTTTARVMTRISPAASNTPQGVPPVSAPTTTSTTLVIRPLSTVPSTNAPPAKFSLNEIASNVGAVDNARAVSATSGALSGQLSPSFNVADVPLAGPGTWSMTTSSPARTTVQCANLEARVQTQIVIGSKENCQLIITAVPPATSLTWQLTPVT